MKNSIKNLIKVLGHVIILSIYLIVDIFTIIIYFFADLHVGIKYKDWNFSFVKELWNSKVKYDFSKDV